MIEHISAGQLTTGKAQRQKLQAHLGTCVGLAIYDPTTRIGGLIHILLPEPPFSGDVEYPEKYASTGVPMLINQLRRLGAKPENMRATIAGGALVGPVSRQDVNLDIGGRSCEIVTVILETSYIKISKSETGGFFSCMLELDMATGKTQIEPIFQGQIPPGNIQRNLSQDDIRETIEHLKPVPQTALKVMRMSYSGQHSMSDLTDEIAKDQVLSGQTLKLCNSSLFAGLVKIESLKDGVLLLGESMLIKSVIAAAINDYFSQTGTSGYSLCKGGLFFHAVGVAAVCDKIAEKTNHPIQKSAYTAGLLHDIGKVILDQHITDVLPYFFRRIHGENENFIQSEKEILGMTHCEAGSILAETWQFPDNLIQTVRHHHEPEKAGKDKALVYAVYLADLLMDKFATGFELDNMQTESLTEAVNFLGLGAIDLVELIDAIPLAETPPIG